MPSNRIPTVPRRGAQDRYFELEYEKMSNVPSPVKTRIIRVDLPMDLYEEIETLALDENLGRGAVMIQLLRKGLASSERR